MIRQSSFVTLRFLALWPLALLSSAVLPAAALSPTGDGGLPYFYQGTPVVVTGGTPGATARFCTADGATVTETVFDGQGRATVAGLAPGYYQCTAGTERQALVVTWSAQDGLSPMVGCDAHLSEDAMYGAKDAAGRADDFRKHLILARHSGATRLRDRFRWAAWEPAPGKWRDDVYRTYYAPQLAAGFHLLPAVESLPDWAAELPGQPLGPPRMAAWEGLFRRLSRYAGEIPQWQVWNEPNPIGIAGSRFPGGITPRKYVDAFVIPARRAVADSRLQLVLGGSAGMDPAWQQGLLDAGAMKELDRFDIHPYATEPFTFEPAMRDLLVALDRAHYTRPILGTEFHVSGPDALAQMYTLWFTLDPRLRRGTLYKFDLRDWPDGTKLGLANLDFSPKPEFAAMNLVSHRLAGAEMLKTVREETNLSVQLIRGAAGTGRFATLYGRGEAQTVCLWTGTPHISLTPAAGGPPRRLATLDGVAAIPLPPDTFYYLDGIQELEPRPDVMRVTAPPATGRTVTGQGRPVPCLEVALANPLRRPTVFQAQLADAAGHGLGAPQNVRLAAGGTAAVRLPLPAADIFPVREERLAVTLREPASGFAVTMPVAYTLRTTQEFAFSLNRDADNRLRNLTVRAAKGGDAVAALTVFTDDGELAAEPGGARDGAWRFRQRGAPFPDDRRVPLRLRVRLASGLTYERQEWLGSREMIDAAQDQVNGDLPMVHRYAQPFRSGSGTLSGVALSINNWTQDTFTLPIRITEGTPDGRTLVRGQLRLIPGGQEATFRFERLLTGLKADTPYWIVTEAAIGNGNVRWCGRNPWPERPGDAKMSYEGAAWQPLTPPDFGWFGFAFKTYK